MSAGPAGRRRPCRGGSPDRLRAHGPRRRWDAGRGRCRGPLRGRRARSGRCGASGRPDPAPVGHRATRDRRGRVGRRATAGRRGRTHRIAHRRALRRGSRPCARRASRATGGRRGGGRTSPRRPGHRCRRGRSRTGSLARGRSVRDHPGRGRRGRGPVPRRPTHGSPTCPGGRAGRRPGALTCRHDPARCRAADGHRRNHPRYSCRQSTRMDDPRGTAGPSSDAVAPQSITCRGVTWNWGRPRRVDPGGPPPQPFLPLNVGGDLLSHTLAGAVPSALEGLASGFGMGPGVPHSATTTDNTTCLSTPTPGQCPGETTGVNTPPRPLPDRQPPATRGVVMVVCSGSHSGCEQHTQQHT